MKVPESNASFAHQPLAEAFSLLLKEITFPFRFV